MQIPDEVRKAVFFVCFMKNDEVRLAGTGFFVSLPVGGNSDNMFVYLITAKHVIVNARNHSDDGKIWIRLNTRAGEAALVDFDVSAWKEHPSDSTVDAMVLHWSFDIAQYDYLTLPARMVATDRIFQRESISVGDEVFLTGLFVNHYGKQKNIPIVRIGNIAAMPEEPVQTREFGSVYAYLIEARSIGGLSGSPVFVHVSGLRSINGVPTLSPNQFYWLGLMHGHWDLPVTAQDTVVADSLSKEAVNMGIGIVIPATKIMEIINQPYFDEIRHEITNIHERRTFATKGITR
jgi:hypothetical protein